MRTLVVRVALCAAGPAMSPPHLAAQWPPDSLVNLQVLPDTLTVRQIVSIMRANAVHATIRSMAQIHRAQGDIDAAIGALERAAAAEPDNDFYPRAIQQLRARRNP